MGESSIHKKELYAVVKATEQELFKIRLASISLDNSLQTLLINLRKEFPDIDI